MDNIEQLIATIEATLRQHEDRISKVEGKLEKDYNSIMSLIEDVQQLKEASQANSEMTARLITKVAELETSFNAFMEKMQKVEAEQDLKFVGIMKKLDKQNKLLWMVCGSRDGLIGNSTQLKAFCDENGIPCTLIQYPDGEHNFVVWKYGLYKFAQLIFK